MYQEWPFFQSTMDLIEMILAKADMRIAQLYDEQLVHDPAQRALGATIRERFLATVQAVLQVPTALRPFQTYPSLHIESLGCLDAVLLTTICVPDTTVLGMPCIMPCIPVVSSETSHTQCIACS
jgi:hypothetical protein